MRTNCAVWANFSGSIAQLTRGDFHHHRRLLSAEMFLFAVNLRMPTSPKSPCFSQACHSLADLPALAIMHDEV
jgi:hypothetical protein